MTDVSPPNTVVWWDVDQVTDAALAILRLTDADVDAGRIRDDVPVAGTMIANRVDWAVAIIPDAVLDRALVTAVIALYRQKDSPPATADDFGLAPGYPPADPLQPVWAMLAPYRRRWGVG